MEFPDDGLQTPAGPQTGDDAARATRKRFSYFMFRFYGAGRSGCAGSRIPVSSICFSRQLKWMECIKSGMQR